MTGIWHHRKGGGQAPLDRRPWDRLRLEELIHPCDRRKQCNAGPKTSHLNSNVTAWGGFSKRPLSLLSGAHTHTEKREREMATTWKQEEISALAADYEELAHIKSDAVTKYNPTPGAPPASLVLPSFCPHSLPPQQQPRSRPRVVGKGRERRLTTRSLFRALVQAPGGRGTCRSPRTTTPSTRTRRSTSPSCSQTEGSSQVSRASRIAPHRIDDGGGS